MAIPNQVLMDAIIGGIGIAEVSSEIRHVPLREFFDFPERGERDPWGRSFWLGRDVYDDGGGAAIAAYQYGLCPFS